MIVKIYDEEELTAPFIGVDVQMRTKKDKGNFTDCLTKKISDYRYNNSGNSSSDEQDRHSSQVIASASRTFHKG